MKKIIYALVLFSSILTIKAQDKFNTIALNYAPNNNTMNAELTSTEHNFIFGVGYGFYVGNEIKGTDLPTSSPELLYIDSSNKLPHHAYYLLMGGRVKHFNIVGKIGLKNENRIVYIADGTGNLYNSQLTEKNNILIGCAVRYDILKNIGVSVGVDNFNKFNFGLGYSF